MDNRRFLELYRYASKKRSFHPATRQCIAQDLCNKDDHSPLRRLATTNDECLETLGGIFHLQGSVHV